MRWGGPFDPNADAIYVIASISEGHGYRRKIRCLVDTGTKLTVIDESITASIGLDRTKAKGKVTFDSLSEAVEGYWLRAPQFEAYGRTLESFEVACCPMNTRLKIDGLIGLDFFRRLEACFNFKSGVVHLED